MATEGINRCRDRLVAVGPKSELMDHEALNSPQTTT